MKILSVEKGGLADELGLMPRDDILAINGHAIGDILDFQFWAAEDDLTILFQRERKRILVKCQGGFGSFGADFEPFTYRCCGNNCLFCFVDQNPPGLRSSLMFKDEDFRLSFLYGNYVTLTNVSRKNLERIVTQRLSPLFISVHAVESEVRRKMLGIRRNDRILEKIAYLCENRIEIHAQIVLCPGWNDGVHLDCTVDTLAGFYPGVKSVAIVPVGLTRHRRHLPEVIPVDSARAGQVIRWSEKKGSGFLSRLDSWFIYLSDEFYLLAGHEIPGEERYEDFAQIENGVGLVRDFIDGFRNERKDYPANVSPVKVAVVTGFLMAPVLKREILPVFAAIVGMGMEIIPVSNRFFGGGVTVSGLLTGQDIAFELGNRRETWDVVLIPPNCLNHDGLFLDNWSVEDLRKQIDVRIFQPQRSFAEIFTQDIVQTIDR